MVLLVDNYDSFSYNLVQMIGEKEKNIKVIRNDEYTCEEIAEMGPSHIILSPGPGRPVDAGKCEEIVLFFKERVPILGVCLGHQAICEVFGATITYAKRLQHGKMSIAEIDTKSKIFEGLPEKIEVGRYHSLAADEKTIPNCLNIIARSVDGEIMAVKHENYEIYGLQFHPESILTKHGKEIIANFMEKGE